MTSEEFLEKTGLATEDAQKDLSDLLKFAKKMLGSTRLGKHTKAKTIVRFNTFSAMYQRADGVLQLTKANQGTVANIVVRSMWETLTTYDFINLKPGNSHINLLLALESDQMAKNWRHIKQLRSEYPNANTWQSTITDRKIADQITFRQDEVNRYKQKNPTLRLGSYSSLLNRLKFLDDTLIAKNPNYQTVTQFDYRTSYSIMSGDAHSTLLGNIENSRVLENTGVEVRLDSNKIEILRSVQVAYMLLLSFLRSFNRTFKLKFGKELAEFSKKAKKHHKQFSDIESQL